MRKYLRRLSGHPLFAGIKSIITPIKSKLSKRFFPLRVPALPSHIIIEATNLCNLKCPFCYQSSPDFRTPKGSMDFDLFRKMAEEFSSLHGGRGSHGTIILYTTGEIFLHKQWKEMVALCSELGLSSVISTNGQLMGRDAVDGILESGLTQLRFSIEGYDKETYEKKRAKGNFERLIANLEYMRKTFLKHPGKKPSVLIRAVLFPQEHNREYYKRFFDLWGKYAGSISFSPLLTQHGQMVNQISRKNLRGKRKPCLFPFQSLTVNYDGSVGFCCTDYNHTINVGKFPDTTLQEIWTGVKLNKIRGMFRKKQYDDIPEICRRCEATFHVDNPNYKIATFKTDEEFEKQARR